MRYLLGIFGVVVTVLLLVLLITGRSSTPSSPGNPNASTSMTRYANQNSTVSLTTRGREVGDSERRAIRISVTATERRIEILGGYDENVLRSQSYPNTQTGYENFLYSMERAGFARTRNVTVTDERGVCPLGNQYIYTVAEGATYPVRSWSTTCSTAEGTFAGVAGTVRQLFQLQIPDYSRQVSDVRL